MAFCLKTGMV